MNPPEKKKKRGGKGRKKIEMKPIVNAKSRLVCFSKRRQGLFTKANELCNLCGAEVAVVVFSPSGTPFSYGHPSINDVVNRFLNGGAGPSDASLAADDRFDLIKRNLEYWGGVLEAERLMRGHLEAALRDRWSTPKPIWWDADIHSMGVAELRDYQRVLLQNQFAVAQAKHRLGFPEPTAEIGKSVSVAGAPSAGTSGTEFVGADFNGSDGGL